MTSTETPATVATTTDQQLSATSGVNATPTEVDAVAEILATAGSYWGPLASSTTLHIVERLGTANADGFIEYSDTSPVMSHEQRDVIAKALAPRTVLWVPDPDEVRGTVPPITVPSGEAIVMFSAPAVEGSQARVHVNVWCGMLCGGGVGLVLEQTTNGEWTVTEEFDGFVA